ncbi:hypothetical protein [Spiroplasma chinense]|nr:hypothetical protein [Spiroplasma chinense]
MNNSDLKLLLVHYFIKVEKYKADLVESDDYISVLVNPKNKTQLIAIGIGELSGVEGKIFKVKEKHTSGKREAFNVLKISITEESFKDVVCVSNLKEAKAQLIKDFPKITSLEETKQEESEPDLSEEEILESLKNPNSSENKKLKKLVSSMNTQTAVSMSLMVLFCIIPIITFGLWIFLSTKVDGLAHTGIASLFFGGSNRALTIVGHQFWRIFTYGFSLHSAGIFGALIEVAIVLVLYIRLARYTEGIIGSWKYAFIMFVTYPLTGFFLSVMVPGMVFTGILGFASSTITVLGVTTWNKKSDTVTLFSKNRLILPLLVMIMYTILFKDSSDYLIIVTAAGISGSITLLFTYDYSRPDFYLAFPIIMLIGLILLPFIFLFVPSYGIAPDFVSMYTLAFYAQTGVMKTNYLNNIIYNLNGWQFSLQDINGVISLVPFK